MTTRNRFSDSYTEAGGKLTVVKGARDEDPNGEPYSEDLRDDLLSGHSLLSYTPADQQPRSLPAVTCNERTQTAMHTSQLQPIPRR